MQFNDVKYALRHMVSGLYLALDSTVANGRIRATLVANGNDERAAFYFVNLEGSSSGSSVCLKDHHIIIGAA